MKLSEFERLEFLFDLYRKHTDPLAIIKEKETRKAKLRKKALNIIQKHHYFLFNYITINNNHKGIFLLVMVS